jgi:hypothetical protein
MLAVARFCCPRVNRSLRSWRGCQGMERVLLVLLAVLPARK